MDGVYVCCSLHVEFSFSAAFSLFSSLSAAGDALRIFSSRASFINSAYDRKQCAHPFSYVWHLSI